MKTKPETNSEPKSKTKLETILEYIEEYKAFIAIPAMFALFLALRDKVTDAFVLFIVPIVGIFRSSIHLDIFFVFVTLCIVISGIKLFKPYIKVISDNQCAILILLLAIYLYYRVFSTDFEFHRFFNSGVAYLDVFAFFFVIRIVAWWSVFFRQKKDQNEEDSEKKEKKFVSDSPIPGINADVFRMEDQVMHLVDYLNYIDVSERSFSLGLSGQWGSGKTSLFNMIKSMIKAQNETPRKYDYIIVDFNPRISKKAEFIQDDFLRTLKRKLSSHYVGMNKYFSEYAAALNLSSDMPAIISLIVGLFKVKAKDWRESFDSLDKAIVKLGKKIIVFIDDLDRLNGEEIMETMKIIGTNASFKNILYITSYDKQYVNEALAGYLHYDKNMIFTDKYFDAEVDVPIHIYEKLAEQLKNLLKYDVGKKILYLSDKEVDEVIDISRKFLKSRLLTIRDIKRFYNQFIFDYQYLQRDVRVYDFLLLSLIKYSDKEEYEKLNRLEYIELKSLFIGSPESMWFLKDNLAPLKPSPDGSEIEDKREFPKCVDILRAMFPTNVTQDSFYNSRANRIYSIASFETYFFHFEYNHLYAKDFGSLYALGLKEACEKIDSWNDQASDLQDYLQTRDVLNFGDKDRLAHFFGILLYSKNRYSSIRLTSSVYSFLRVQEINDIKERYGFSDEEYIEWLKDNLIRLSEINAECSGPYVNSLMNSLCKDPSREELFLPIASLRKISLALLEDYLKKIDLDNWKPSTTFYLSQVWADGAALLVPEASNLLRKSMVARPEKYIDALIPICQLGDGMRNIRFDSSFLLKEVFPNKGDFEEIINDARVSGAEHLELIKKLWQLYKHNDYSPVKTADEVKNNPESISSWIDKQIIVLNEMLSLDKSIDKVNSEWLARRRLNNVEEFKARYEEIKGALKNISLNITYMEKLKIDVADSISHVIEYEEYAQDLTMDDIQEGDIVMLPTDILEKMKDRMIFSNNLFSILKKEAGDMVKLSFIDGPISVSSIKAVPINGKNDADIYYAPIGMATIVEPGQSAPEHRTDKSYYIDQFDRWTDQDKTYNELLASVKPQFVHEVQHWLREKFGHDDLKINLLIKN